MRRLELLASRLGIGSRTGLATAAGIAIALGGFGQGNVAFAGSTTGLSTVRALHLPNPPLDGHEPGSDGFASSFASGDFDGDGFTDLAVGAPGGDGDPGFVVVYFGSPGGLDPTTARRIAQTGFENESGDRHGRALAACDFDADGFDDLAVGAPGETRGESEQAGAVLIYPGGPDGPSSGTFVALDQDSPGTPEVAEDEDRFGSALACGRFGADEYADLAIGAPWESIGTADRTGWVVVLRGGPQGLSPSSGIAYTQIGDGLPTFPDDGDDFGAALAAGDMNGDGLDDLAIGVPGELLGAGMVHVLFGGAAAPSLGGALTFDEASIGGLREDGDGFGSALAYGDFDADGADDLVIGIPYEDFACACGPTNDNGQAAVIYGGSTIPGAGGVDWWAENNIHGPLTTESGDRFGWTVVAGDFDADGFDDVVFGHPGEDGDRGAVTAIAGSASGLTAARRSRFATAEAGVPGTPAETGDATFGNVLATGDFDGDGHADLAIGSPSEGQGEIAAYVGAATMLHGALFADGFADANAEVWEVTNLAALSPHDSSSSASATAASNAAALFSVSRASD